MSDLNVLFGYRFALFQPAAAELYIWKDGAAPGYTVKAPLADAHVAKWGGAVLRCSLHEAYIS
jgi:hypothetical protein